MVGGDSLDAFVDMMLWSFIGLALMLASRLVNNHALLYRSGNASAIRDGNTAVAVVELGAYAASGLLVRAATSGSDGSEHDEWVGLLSTLIWFATGQVVMVGATLVVQCVTHYDDQKLIFDGNVAAGIKFCGTLLSVGILVSHPITVSDSVVTFAAFSGIGIALQTLMRRFLDRLVLPHTAGRSVDVEIAEDGNWGVALLEASIAVSLALIGTAFMVRRRPPPRVCVCRSCRGAHALAAAPRARRRCRLTVAPRLRSETVDPSWWAEGAVRRSPAFSERCSMVSGCLAAVGGLLCTPRVAARRVALWS